MNEARISLERLVEGQFTTVVIAAPDLTGRLFGRRVSPQRFVDLVRGAGVEVCECVLGWDISQDPEPMMADQLAYTGWHNGLGDLVLQPDPATLRPVGWRPGVAIAFADAHDHVGGPLVHLAPRTLLTRAIERLEALGYRASVGTELEFYLYADDPADLAARGYRDPTPTTRSPADYSILEGNVMEPFFQRLTAAVEASGIRTEAGQPEFGLGQWELTLRHTDPAEMADRHALYKMGVREIAQLEGMTATFMARPSEAEMGSSCHVHLSLRDAEGRAAFHDPDDPHHASGVLRAAVGGILEHLKGFSAWYAPTVNSYRRTITEDAAGWGRTWGFDNRSCSVRVVGHDPGTIRLEFRVPGADVNPYLVLAALLASVADGIERDLDPGPPEPGNAYAGAPALDMPQNLGEGIAAFRAAEFPRAAFGDAVVDHHALLLEHEWRGFLRTVTEWERRRYLELI